MAPWLDEYAADSLREPLSSELEAHLLVCDVCFAAYVAMVLRRG